MKSFIFISLDGSLFLPTKKENLYFCQQNTKQALWWLQNMMILVGHWWQKKSKAQYSKEKYLKFCLNQKKKKKVNAQVLQKNVLVSVAEPVLHTL